MISLTQQEVYEALYEAFQDSNGVPPSERSIAELDDVDKKDLLVMTAKLNDKLAVKQSGSA